MRQPQTLPTASPRSLLQAFQEVFRAAEDTVFSQKALERRGVSGHRQALTALHFMGMLTPSGRLDQETRDLRADRGALSKLLCARLHEGCVRVGCEIEAVAPLGCRKLPESELDGLLRSLPPIVRQQQNKYLFANTVSCMRTLHELLARQLDRDWIESELRALQAREELSGRSRRRGPRSNSVRQSGDRLDINEGGLLGCCETAATHDSDRERRLPPPLRTEVPDLNECGLIAETVPIDFDDEEMRIEVDVYLPANLSARQLKRVAQHFIRKAEKVKAIEASSRPLSASMEPAPL